MESRSVHRELSQQEVVHILHVALSHLRAEIDADLPAQRVLTLLAIAANPDIPQFDVPELVDGISAAAVSRNVADLTALTRWRQPGPGLVEQRVDPAFRRRNLLRLTEKGSRLLAKITSTVNTTLARRCEAGA